MKKNEVTLKEALLALVANKKIKQPYDQSRIERVWLENMGPTINNYTRSIRLKSGILYLEIESASLKSEINYSKEKLIQTLNQYLDQKVIKDIRLV